MINYNEALEILEKNNQAHLLNFYNDLTNEERNTLLCDIQNTNFDEINNIIKSNENYKDSCGFNLEPMEIIDKNLLSQAEKTRYQVIGEELIKKRKLAVCTMAGGQGSRLGHNGPKGTFIVPLNEPKSIFQIATEHLLEAYNKYDVYIYWYIMTSEENDIETKLFFEDNNYFGYPKDYIRFFKQGELPLTNFEGKILLQNKYKIFKAANGNGGIFKALEDNGIIDELINNGVEFLATCNVDNILIKPIDDIILGVLKEQNLEIGIKSIIKRDPSEKVGVCGLKDGKPTVIEYIDMPGELAEAKNEDGSLKFGEAHFGSNYLSVKLLERIANQKLPYHCAKKKNKYIGEDGNLVNSDDFNSFKYEMFIFDGFEMAESAIVFRVKREEEFAPIKNKDGEDSPITAAKMYEDYFNKTLNSNK